MLWKKFLVLYLKLLRVFLNHVYTRCCGVVVTWYFAPPNVFRRGWFFCCDPLSTTQCIAPPQLTGLI